MFPTIHHTYTNGVDGGMPQAGLLQAADGNIYGSTAYGGSNGNGVIFRLGLNHTFTPLHSFTGLDGANPLGSLIQASDGNFYGTTSAGGSNSVGSVFRFSTNGQLTSLYSFAGNNGANTDGQYPGSGLIQGADGRLYGATYNGGSNFSGTIFRMTTNGAYSQIYTFSNSQDGGSPMCLVKAPDGNMYGAAYTGGSNGVGGIFRLTTNGVVKPIYSFRENVDGAYPMCLVFGKDGNLYGSTFSGGTNDLGSIFRCTTNGVVTPVYSFTGGTDGQYPQITLMQAADGNLYGTAFFYGNIYFGGTSTMFGNIFRLSTNSVYTNLYQFSGPVDGANPQGGLLAASDGLFYGVTSAGGGDINGTLFSSPVYASPVNDNFTNRSTLVGFDTGYNVAATLETREPAAGGGVTNVNNTVWWSWTAPNNGPVSILTAGSTFDTILDVYTGSTISNLSLVTSNLTTVLDTEMNTNLLANAGITNHVNFTATAGTHYQIQVSGLNSGNIAIAAQTTALKILSVTPLSTNADGSIPFNAQIQIGNSGAITPGPLQLEILAHAGFSYNTEPPNGPPDSSLIPADHVLTNYLLSQPVTVLPGMITNLLISGICPGPTLIKQFPGDQTNTLGFGWGVFAVLNEQFGTNWFFDDNALLLYGKWPVVPTNPGPQAGVVRLNPSVNGSTPVFQSAQIKGPLMVAQNSTSNFFGTANFVNGSTVVPVYFTNTAWSSSRFSINTNGIFQAGSVVTNTPVTLAAPYAYTYYGQSITNIGQLSVLVMPSLSPSLSASASLADHSFTFTLNSLPTTKYVLQAATNLLAPVNWIPLATNFTDTNGVWTFIDLGAITRPQRYYRAMKAP